MVPALYSGLYGIHYELQDGLIVGRSLIRWLKGKIPVRTSNLYVYVWTYTVRKSTQKVRQ